MWHKLFEMIDDGIKIKISAEIVIGADEKPNAFTAKCNCGWYKAYSSNHSMKRGLENHRKHCDGTAQDKHAIDPDDYQWISGGEQ